MELVCDKCKKPGRVFMVLQGVAGKMLLCPRCDPWTVEKEERERDRKTDESGIGRRVSVS